MVHCEQKVVFSVNYLCAYLDLNEAVTIGFLGRNELKAVAWTEQRLKQSVIAWLSAELHCWGSGVRLCTTLLCAWLPAVPVSVSFNKLRKGQGLSACSFCLPFALWSQSRVGQNIAELAVVCRGAWDKWVYPVSMRLLSLDLGYLVLFLPFSFSPE